LDGGCLLDVARGFEVEAYIATLVNNVVFTSEWAHEYFGDDLKWVVFSMEELIKPKPSLYCPITVSDMATNNAKVRQNSLREYSHAQNAAYRAFCRGPGRPQTAAFGRVYSETGLNRRSLSPSKVNLRDCIVASKATVEERNDANHCPVKHSCGSSQPIFIERRRLLSRGKSAGRTRRLPEKLKEEEAIKISGYDQSLKYISVKVFNDKEEADDFLIEPDTGSGEKRYDTKSSEERNKITPVEDSLPDSFESQLIVNHFVDNGCSCTAADSYHGDPLVGCKACSCDQRFQMSSYSVEMQGEGHQSTPGLGNYDSQENKALLDLLQKQLSLVCY